MKTDLINFKSLSICIGIIFVLVAIILIIVSQIKKHKVRRRIQMIRNRKTIHVKKGSRK